MRAMIGCSLSLALVAFVLGLAGSLLAREATWLQRLGLAAMPAVMTFVAALLLGGRDHFVQMLASRAVRRRLFAADEMSDAQFLAVQPTDDADLLLATRRAIAGFYAVPPERIRRDVRLRDDLQVEKFEGPFIFHVVGAVVRTQNARIDVFRFSLTTLETIDQLATAIRTVLNGAGENQR